jgi:hypothetical protein
VTRYLDEVSPASVGEDAITVKVAEGSRARLIVGKIIDLTVDYSSADPEGIQLPLRFTIQGPTRESFDERYFSNIRPKSISFVPLVAGTYFILLKECFNNRRQGRLRVTISGERSARERV